MPPKETKRNPFEPILNLTPARNNTFKPPSQSAGSSGRVYPKPKPSSTKSHQYESADEHTKKRAKVTPAPLTLTRTRATPFKKPSFLHDLQSKENQPPSNYYPLHDHDHDTSTIYQTPKTPASFQLYDAESDFDVETPLVPRDAKRVPPPLKTPETEATIPLHDAESEIDSDSVLNPWIGHHAEYGADDAESDDAESDNAGSDDAGSEGHSSESEIDDDALLSADVVGLVLEDDEDVYQDEPECLQDDQGSILEDGESAWVDEADVDSTFASREELLTGLERKFVARCGVLNMGVPTQYHRPDDAEQNIRRFRNTMAHIIADAQALVQSIPYNAPDQPFARSVSNTFRHAKYQWLVDVIIGGFRIEAQEILGRSPCTREDLLSMPPPRSVVELRQWVIYADIITEPLERAGAYGGSGTNKKLGALSRLWQYLGMKSGTIAPGRQWRSAHIRKLLRRFAKANFRVFAAYSTKYSRVIPIISEGLFMVYIKVVSIVPLTGPSASFTPASTLKFIADHGADNVQPD